MKNENSSMKKTIELIAFKKIANKNMIIIAILMIFSIIGIRMFLFQDSLESTLAMALQFRFLGAIAITSFLGSRFIAFISQEDINKEVEVIEQSMEDVNKSFKVESRSLVTIDQKNAKPIILKDQPGRLSFRILSPKKKKFLDFAYPLVFLNQLKVDADFDYEGKTVEIIMPSTVLGEAPRTLTLFFDNREQTVFLNPFYMDQELLDVADITWSCKGEVEQRKITLCFPEDSVKFTTGFEPTFNLYVGGVKRGTFTADISSDYCLEIPLGRRVSKEDEERDFEIRLLHTGVKTSLPVPVY